MSFHHPWLLLLLVLPIMHGFWLWVRRGQPLVAPLDHARLRDGRWLRRSVIAAEMIVSLLMADVVLLLAGPRSPAPPVDERVMNNIVFVLDVSGSMAMNVSPGVSRYDAAMQNIRAFCRHRKGDAFGLTIFGAEFLHWLPPTKELSAIECSTPFLRPGNLPYWFGGTMIAKALEGTIPRLLATPEGDRAIILVTDGQSSDFQNGRDREVALKLAEAKIRVFTILIGNEQATGVNLIAAQTGGRVFQAADPQTLSYVFSEIDRMQKARFRPSVADWVDRTLPFAVAGLGLLGFFALSQWGLRFTPW